MTDDIAAAIAAAREEQREACARAVIAIGPGEGRDFDAAIDEAVDCVRDTPLTATPLADEIRALRERVRALEGSESDRIAAARAEQRARDLAQIESMLGGSAMLGDAASPHANALRLAWFAIRDNEDK